MKPNAYIHMHLHVHLQFLPALAENMKNQGSHSIHLQTELTVSVSGAFYS